MSQIHRGKCPKCIRAVHAGAVECGTPGDIGKLRITGHFEQWEGGQGPGTLKGRQVIRR